ncbi:DMT family transporter [Marinisporobacter balticus]|uniref:Drug/metabolite transporter (DMT)-like permease n=1 Tax=Marinisporobacter balticus TaxID=2018667 RepID=A0A4V6NPF9_9FIRM|nr:DMT family transporter [Marinisporobacter balticus]TCO77420.1 drug/metabolite transporter (DMT)-like permease [Marinisporobacter balticus]
MKRGNAEIIMIVIVAMWGLSFSLTKPILNDIEIFNFMAIRFLMGGGLLSILLFLIGYRKITREQWIGGTITGTVLFFAFTFHTIGLKYTTVAKNAFIVGTSVVFVPFIVTCIRKQKQPPLIWVGTCLAIIGLALVTLEGHQGNINFGDLMTLIGSIILAYYIILVEEYVKKYDAKVIAAIQIVIVGFLSLIESLMIETPTIHLSSEAWSRMLFLGIVCTALTYLSANIAQKYIPATNIVLIYTLEPIFATLFGWIFLSEMIGLQAVIGSVVIVIGVGMPNMGMCMKKIARRIQAE